MKEKINNIFKKLEINYYIDNELTLFIYTGGVYFFKKSFNSFNECYDFIIKKYDEFKKFQNDIKKVNDYYQKNKTLKGCYFISKEYTKQLQWRFKNNERIYH